MSTPARIPGIPYAALPRAASKAAGLSWPPRLIVIHATDNTANAAAEAHYASTRADPSSSWTSAHAYVDEAGPLGSLPLSQQAWAAYSYANAHGIHIEMCGRSGAVPAATVAHTTALVRTLLGLGAAAAVKLSPADVAAGKAGVCGHRDITLGLHVGDHEDPGAGFDWAGFMAQVTAGATALAEEDDLDAYQNDTLNNIDAWAASGGEMASTLTIHRDGKTYTFDNKLVTAVKEIASGVQALQGGGIGQDALNAAVRQALADPAVVAPLVDAVADALSQRLAN